MSKHSILYIVLLIIGVVVGLILSIGIGKGSPVTIITTTTETLTTPTTTTTTIVKESTKTATYTETINITNTKTETLTKILTNTITKTSIQKQVETNTITKTKTEPITITTTLPITRTLTTTITTTTTRIPPLDIKGNITNTYTIGNWEITVLSVKEAKSIKKGEILLKPENSTQKIVVITLTIRNIGEEFNDISDIMYALTTNTTKAYKEASILDLNATFVPSESELEKAVLYEPLPSFQSLPPLTYTQGDIIFVITENEKPVILWIKPDIMADDYIPIKLP